MKHNTTSSRPAGRRSAATMRGFALRPLAFAALVLTQGVQALPTGIQPTVGVQVNQTDASNMVITTTAQKTIINTQTFGIAAQEKLTVAQPGVTSSTMFSVKGYDPSYVFGSLQSNGRVFLQNPNGIVFGANARVDVGGLVATTMHVRDTDVMAGRYLLTDDGQGQGDLAGRVVNQGTINAPHGSVVLAGREVINSGQILAEGGRVGLIAASKVLVDVEGDGLLFFEVEGKEAGARLEQLGRIEANGGSVELMAASRGQMADTVLNMSGVVQARTLGLKNGRVVIDGGDTGITAVSGTVDVTGADAGQTGGDAVVQGQRVLIGSTALIDASGSAGGGQVRVGGGFHGTDVSVRNAEMVTVQRGARIKANALTSGNGGLVAIWSNMGTRFFGNVEARGAGSVGEGGVVEVSGYQFLDYSGLVDVTADSGLTGVLLLDPTELTIQTTGDNQTGGTGSTSDPFVSTGTTSTLGWDTIKHSLQTANTKVQTSSGDIFIKDASGDLNEKRDLTLQSAADIVQNTGAVIANGGLGGITLQAGAGGAVSLQANITAGGGVTIVGPLKLNQSVELKSGTAVSKVNVQGDVTGNGNNLTLTNLGNTTDADAIKTNGTITGVANFKTNARTTLGGDVFTTGTQTYDTTVTLGTSVNLKASGVSFVNVSGGANNLGVRADSVAVTGSATGTGTVTFEPVSDTGTISVAGGSPAAAGTLQLSQALMNKFGSWSTIVLGNTANAYKIAFGDFNLPTQISVRSSSGDISFKALNNNASIDAQTTGRIDLNDLIGGSTALSSLNINGQVHIGTSSVKTAGNQSYATGSGSVTVDTNTSLDAGGAKIALAAVEGGGKNLTLTSTNTAADAIKTNGAVNNVAILNVNGKSTLGGDVTTTGKQTYGDAVTLSTAVKLDSGNAKISLKSVEGGGNNLTTTSKNTEADAIKVGGAINNVAALLADGKITLGNNVSTTGTQTYKGVITLDTNAVELKTADATSKLDLQGGVAGNSQNLTLTNTANTTDADAIKTGGAISNVAVLSVDGNTTLGGDVTTSGNQTYTKAVVLGANSQLDAGASKISLASVDAAGKNLTLKSTNAAADAIKASGAISNVAALNVAGKSTLNGSITSTGSQTYGNTLTLVTDTQLDAGGEKISLAGVDAAGKNLTLKSTNAGADAIKTSSTIGNVAALTVTGKSTLGGNVTSTGDQSYSDVVKLGANVQLDAGSAKIALAGVDGSTRNLTLKSTNASADAIKTTGAIGNVAALTVTGKSTLGGNVTTTGKQSYGDAVTLGGADSTRVLTAGTDIDLGAVAGAGKNLTVAASGTATLGGAISGVAALDTTGSGATQINTDINATTQRYGSSALGGAGTTRTLSGENVSLAAVGGNGMNLTVDASDKATLGGDVSGVKVLSVKGSNGIAVGAKVSTDDAQSYTGTVSLIGASVFKGKSLTFNGALVAGDKNIGFLTDGLSIVGTLSGSGNAQLGGFDADKSIGLLGGTGDATISADAIQNLIDAGFSGVTIGSDGAGAVNVGGAVASALDLKTNLTLSSGTGAITVSSDVTGQFNFGAKTGGAVELSGRVNVASVDVSGSRVKTSSSVQTTRDQVYTGSTGDVELQASTTARNLTVNAAGGALVLGSTQVTNDVNVTGRNVSVGLPVSTAGDQSYTSTSGDVVLLGAVGRVDKLSVSAAGAASLAGVANATSVSVTSSGPITVQSNVTTSGSQTYNRQVVLGTSPVELKSTGGTGTINLQGGVDGNGQNLNLVNTANASAADAIKTGGAISNVATLNVTGKSTLGGNVTSTGNQTYGDAVTLGANAQLDAGGSKISLTSVNGGGRDLTLKSTNATADAIKTGGVISNVAELTVSGMSTLGGNVTSTGNQTYTGTVTLAGNTQLDAGGSKIALVNVAGGTHDLTLKSTNAAADAVRTTGLISNVAALTVSGKSMLGGNVITTGNQSYSDTVTLTGGTVLNASDAKIVLNGVDGSTNNLTLISANADADAIKTNGAIHDVAALDVRGNATLGGNVSTSGSQTYRQAVTLGANVALSSALSGVSLQQLFGGNHVLSVSTATGLDFNNTISGLGGLDVTAGATRFNGLAGLTTTGAQHYAGNVVLQAGTDATFTASSLNFGGSVTGSRDLNLNTDHLTAGVLSGTGELHVAPTSAGTTIGLNGATGDVALDLTQVSGFTRHTIGSANAGQVQANALTLGVDTTIQSGGEVDFNELVNGPHALTVNAAGTTHFFKGVAGDDVTHIAPLTSLTVTGDTVLHGDKLITSGAQTYGGNFSTAVLANKFDLEASTVSMLHGFGGLTFGKLHLRSGGTIVTSGLISLVDNVNLDGGTLTLESTVAPGPGRTIVDPDGIQRNDLVLNNRLLKESALAITQTKGTITTAAGSTLNLRASAGGSIVVDHVESGAQNNIQGSIVAISGTQGDTNSARFTTGPSTLVLGTIRIGSNQIHSAGIEADAVRLTAGALDTAPGTKIRARLPYVNAQGTETSLPALTLVPTNPTAQNQFGTTNPSTWIQVDVGDAAGGYITVRPSGAGSGSSAIFLGGTNGATPFYDGSGKVSEIQVYYNGLTPATPQEVGALNAVTAVIEESRRARFEEVVRTENVSARLRQGVIAEVGSGRPATEGSESIRMPQSCTPKNGLGC